MTAKNRKFAFVKHFGASLICIAALAGANPTLSTTSWVNITPPGLTPTSDPTVMLGCGLAVDPNNPSNIWWANGTFQPSTKGGLYKSTDGGSTWRLVPPFDVPLHIRINPKDSRQMYVVDGVRGSYMGFWKSTDGGNTWVQPQGFKNTANDPTVGTSDGYSIAVDPSDFNHVLFSFHSPWPDRAGYTYSCGALESKDGGETWAIRYPTAGMTGPGFAIFFLYSPDLKVGNKDTWLMGCQGSSYYRTSDAGATWKEVNTNQMTHGGDQLYYTKAGVLFAGTSAWPSGPMHSTDNGITWLACNLPAMYTIGVMGDGTTLYTGGFNGTSPVYVSPETDGVNWTKFNNQTFGSGPFELDFDKTNSIMYMSTPADGIWALKTASGTTDVTANHRAVSPAGSISRNIVGMSKRGITIQKANREFYDVNGRNIKSR